MFNSNLAEKLQLDLKQAQLSRDERKTSTLRLLLSEIRYGQIAKGSELSDEELLSLIGREIKKRKEAAAGFRQGGREGNAQKEEEEAGILASYLPAQLSDEELNSLTDEAIKQLGAASLQDMGKVMGLVMSKVAGKAEGGRVSTLVKQKLSS